MNITCYDSRNELSQFKSPARGTFQTLASGKFQTPRIGNITNQRFKKDVLSPQRQLLRAINKYKKERKGLPELFSPQRYLDPIKYQTIENLLKYKKMRQMKNINSTQYNIQNNNSFEEVKIRSPKKLFKFKKKIKKAQKNASPLKPNCNIINSDPNFLEEPTKEFKVKISRASRRFETCPFLNYNFGGNQSTSIPAKINKITLLNELKENSVDSSNSVSSKSSNSKEVSIQCSINNLEDFVNFITNKEKKSMKLQSNFSNFLNVDSAYAANDLKSQAKKGSKCRVKSKFSQVLRSQCKRLSYMSSKTISPTAADELAVQNMKSGCNNADKEQLDFNLLTNKLL